MEGFAGAWWRSAFVRRCLIAVSAITAALLPATARAQEWTPGAGIFVGYTFGPRKGFEWGFEAFGTYIFEHATCYSSEPRYGAGALAQFGIMGFEAPRVTLAAHAGGELFRKPYFLPVPHAASGEIGVSYRFGDQAGFGLHTGLNLDTLVLFTLAVRHQWLLDDTWFGGGARFLPTFGSPARCDD